MEANLDDLKNLFLSSIPVHPYITSNLGYPCNKGNLDFTLYEPMAVPMGAYQYPSKPLYTYHSIRAGGGLRNAG
jgi:hypothetical protein